MASISTSLQEIGVLRLSIPPLYRRELKRALTDDKIVDNILYLGRVLI